MSASPTDLPAMDPVLAGVYRRGYSIRRQRVVRRLAAGALSLQLLVALPFAFRQGDDAGGRNVRVVAPAAEDVPVMTTTTEVPVAVVAEEASPTILPVETTTSTTALVCHNSTDRRCGPFRWDPDPGRNEPLTITVTVDPPSPRAGEPVHFRVISHDPDASWFWGKCASMGDKPETCISGRAFDSNQSPDYCADEKFGPWTPPPRIPGHEDSDADPQFAVDYTYLEPGTYTATWEVTSFTTKCGLYGPYGNEGKGTVEVVVRPADSPPSTNTTTAG